MQWLKSAAAGVQVVQEAQEQAAMHAAEVERLRKELARSSPEQ